MRDKCSTTCITGLKYRSVYNHPKTGKKQNLGLISLEILHRLSDITLNFKKPPVLRSSSYLIEVLVLTLTIICLKIKLKNR